MRREWCVRAGGGACGILLLALAFGSSITRAQNALPPEETRAVAFLAREVPKWKAENDCYSCHNNGDAARALIAAARRGHDVGTALDDTLEWLRQPAKWHHNKTTGGIDDKALARVQFAGALRLAVEAGRADRRSLAIAAPLLAADQRPDGSWQLDSSQSLGSPATYGTTLATSAARDVLVAAAPDDVQSTIARADAWLRAAKVESVIDAAAVVLGLGTASDAAATAQRERALRTLRRGQGPDGGWGPYVSVSAEVFDTALVLLALDVVGRPAAVAAAVWSADDLATAVTRGRAYLRSQQSADGSWPETTRPAGQESYAQRISTTGWALLALLETR
jgi:hypothetical protein